MDVFIRAVIIIRLPGPSAFTPEFIPMRRATGPFTTTIGPENQVVQSNPCIANSGSSAASTTARTTGRYSGLQPAITALIATFVTVKSTYSLDVESVRKLEGLAKHWNTSKSAALRRAIHTVARQVHSDDNEALAALDRLQSRLALDRGTAEIWADEVRRERRAAAERSASWSRE